MVEFLTKKREINVYDIQLTRKEYEPLKVIKPLATNGVMDLDESNNEVFRAIEDTQTKDIRETPNNKKVVQ